MKKKIFAGVAVLAIAVAVGFNVNLNQKSDVSLLELANVEALAIPFGPLAIEVAESVQKETYSCWKELSNGESNATSPALTHKTYCGDCSATLCRSWYTESSCLGS